MTLMISVGVLLMASPLIDLATFGCVFLHVSTGILEKYENCLD